MNRSSKNPKMDPKFILAFERGVMRSAFVSLFWSIIQFRKQKGHFTLQGLAKALSTNKAEVSRWFKGDPNWTVNTIASIATALEVDIRIEAIDRKTGQIFTPAGAKDAPITATSTIADDKINLINIQRIFGSDAQAPTSTKEQWHPIHKIFPDRLVA